MRKQLFGAITIVTLTATGASAGDLYPPLYPPPGCGPHPCGPPPQPPPCGAPCAPPSPCGGPCEAPPCCAWIWSGFYGGANLGFEWGTLSNSGAKPNGIIGGVQGGYNWQFGQFVTGLETDFQLTDANDVFTNYKFSNPWFGTVRGRGGWAFNNLLFYGTLGFAYAEGRIDLDGLTDTNVHVGWTTGVGLEVGMTQNWSVKAEYLFLDFDSLTYPNTTHLSHALTTNVARLGVNFHY